MSEGKRIADVRETEVPLQLQLQKGGKSSLHHCSEVPQQKLQDLIQHQVTSWEHLWVNLSLTAAAKSITLVSISWRNLLKLLRENEIWRTSKNAIMMIFIKNILSISNNFFFRMHYSTEKNLMSLNENMKPWEEMSAQERLQFSKDIKAKATIMLLHAQEFLQSKNHAKAKQMFIQMGDYLSCIKEPDSQTLQLLELSCSYLANSYRNQMKNTDANGGGAKVQETFERKENLIVLRYNKFSGEFEIEEKQQSKYCKDLIQYVSKINTILFGCQNFQSNHSIYVIFTTYWLPYLITAIIAIITLIFLVDDQIMIVTFLGLEVPTMISGLLLIVPMIMIYRKQPQQRDTEFFNKKLGDQIALINQDCVNRDKPFTFMMPHGGEINISLRQQFMKRSVNGEKMSQFKDPNEQIINEIRGITRGISRKSVSIISDRQDNMRQEEEI